MMIVCCSAGDGQYDVRFSKIDRMKALSGMLNVYYDYPVTDTCNWYAGAGLGAANVSYRVCAVVQTRSFTDPLTNAKMAAPNWFINQNDTAFKDIIDPSKSNLSKTVFAYQLMTSVWYRMHEHWDVSIGYKFFNTAKVSLLGKCSVKTPFTHCLEFGLTYSF